MTMASSGEETKHSQFINLDIDKVTKGLDVTLVDLVLYQEQRKDAFKQKVN